MAYRLLDADEAAKLLNEAASPATGDTAPRWRLVEETPGTAAPMAAAAPPPAPAAPKRGLVEGGLRQLGLFGRYALEGPAQAAEVVTEPLRYFTDRMTGNTGKTRPLGKEASLLADRLGLPMPEDATERVVGDATRLGMGTMAGNAASKGLSLLTPSGGAGSAVAATGDGFAPNLVQAVKGAPAAMSANPVSQVTGAVGAGGAGSYAKEQGATPGQQMIASLAGGVVGGAVPGVVKRIGEALPRQRLDPATLDIRIRSALESRGVNFDELNQAAKDGLRKDVQEALKLGDLDEVKLERLAAFRQSGMTPTRGAITQNPADITYEKNLSKIAANLKGADHTLPNIEFENNRKAIGNLQNMGAGRGDSYRAGESLIGSVQAKDAAREAAVNEAYARARAMPGGNQPLVRQPLIDDIHARLNAENKLRYLPEQISNTLNDISLGQVKVNGQSYPVPFDANAIENLYTDVAAAQRSAKGSEKRALSLVRDALDNYTAQPHTNTAGRDLGALPVTEDLASALRAKDAQPTQFIKGLRDAASEAKGRFDWRESAKPISDALDGASPDSFVKKYVINGAVEDTRKLLADATPQAREEARNAVLAHLQDRALSDRSTEVGKFSAANYSKALKQLGDRKLSLLFDPGEVEQLKSLGRAADLALNQSAGSAVNNSNSGALGVAKFIQGLDTFAKRVPFGPMVLQPLTGGLQDVHINFAQRAPLSVSSALNSQTLPKGSLLAPYLIPGAIQGQSLLSSGN